MKSLSTLEPEPHERLYYRHHRSGDLGWLVHDKDGNPAIKLDRPGVQNVHPFKDDEWVPLKEYTPYSRAQVVIVAFEADRHLCRLLGRHDLAKREWRGLSQEQRRAWIETGPTGHPMRRELYAAIMGVVGELGR